MESSKLYIFLISKFYKLLICLEKHQSFLYPSYFGTMRRQVHFQYPLSQERLRNLWDYFIRSCALPSKKMRSGRGLEILMHQYIRHTLLISCFLESPRPWLAALISIDKIVISINHWTKKRNKPKKIREEKRGVFVKKKKWIFIFLSSNNNNNNLFLKLRPR